MRSSITMCSDTFEQTARHHASARRRLTRALAILELVHGTDHRHVRQLRGMLKGSEAALETAASKR